MGACRKDDSPQIGDRGEMREAAVPQLVMEPGASSEATTAPVVPLAGGRIVYRRACAETLGPARMVPGDDRGAAAYGSPVGAVMTRGTSARTQDVAAAHDPAAAQAIKLAEPLIPGGRVEARMSTPISASTRPGPRVSAHARRQTILPPATGTTGAVVASELAPGSMTSCGTADSRISPRSPI